MDNREYRRAYLVTQQQLLTDEEFDQTSNEDLNADLLNLWVGNLCTNSESVGFYHRPNTYPHKCGTCDINTDTSMYASEYRGREADEVEPRTPREGDTPLTPENYKRYDEVFISFPIAQLFHNIMSSEQGTF